MSDVQEKIWNIGLVIEDIKNFPQTYNSILKELCNSGTCQTILRRKLNKLCKSGEVCKTNIPGTRFGKVIFYYIPKSYNILIEGTRIGSEVFCFFKYKKRGRFYIDVDELWKLKGGAWKKIKKRTFFEGNVLKFI